MASRSDGDSMSAGVFKNLLGNMVGPLAGLASAPILAHSLGVDGRGFVAGATAPFLLVTTIATFGIPEALTYFIARSPSTVRAIRRRGAVLVVLAGVVATLVSVLLAPLLAGGTPGLAPLMVLASLAVIPTVLVATLRGTAAGLGLWSLVAMERSVGPVVRLLAIVVLVATDQLTVTSATVAIAFAPVLGGLVYLRIPRTASEPGATGSSPGYRGIVGYGSRVWFGAIAGVLLMRIDQVLMVPLSSTFELGLYVVAVTVGELPLVVNTAVREVVFASDARSTDSTRLTAAARISFLVCAAIAIVLGSTSPLWLPVAFGEDFTAAVPTTMMLLAAVAVGIPGSVAGAGLSSRGYPHLRSISLVIACAVNIALLVVLVPLLGAFGAALSTLVGNVVSSNFNILQIRRKFGVPMRQFYLVRAADVRLLVGATVRILPARGKRG